MTEQSSGSREYPARPIIGVAGVVIDNDRVLLIRRGRAPLLGSWSLPGGALKVGETIVEGVAREVFEETGLHVTPLAHLATLDRIVRDTDGRVQYHYVLLDWLCIPTSSAEIGPVAGGDALEAAWEQVEKLDDREGLDEVTLSVIQAALKQAKALSGR